MTCEREEFSCLCIIISKATTWNPKHYSQLHLTMNSVFSAQSKNCLSIVDEDDLYMAVH